MKFSQAKLLWSMTIFEAQRFKAYPHEIIASLAQRLAELALYCTFWLLVSQFSQNSSVQTHDIISYYLIISGLTPFLYAGFGLAALTIDDIKTGRLNQILIRPMNAFLYPLAIRTGRNAINLLFGLVQIAIGIFIAGGIGTEALPFLLPVLFNAVAINLALNILIGTAGFYYGDARGFKNTMYHLANFARGEKMPIHFMTPELAGFLLLTPFPASQYHLAIVLQGTRVPAWGDVLIGMVWSVVLLVLAVKFWRFSLRRYEAVGI